MWEQPCKTGCYRKLLCSGRTGCISTMSSKDFADKQTERRTFFSGNRGLVRKTQSPFRKSESPFSGGKATIGAKALAEKGHLITKDAAGVNER